MSRCHYCGGQIFASPDPDLGPSCFQCGRSNAPPRPHIQPDRRRESRPPTKATPEPKHIKTKNRPRFQRDMDYLRFLVVLAKQTEPFLARDLAAVMGTNAYRMRAWLTKAADQNRVRKVGITRDRDGRREDHGKLTVWEVVQQSARRAS